MPLIVNKTVNFDTSLPTTLVWDISDINDENSTELLILLYQQTNNII